MPDMYVILDRKGRRIVMPRSTPGDAIDQIVKAIAGRNASAEAKSQAWEQLREERGFKVERVRTVG